jgi:hypothetical protein
LELAVNLTIGIHDGVLDPLTAILVVLAVLAVIVISLDADNSFQQPFFGEVGTHEETKLCIRRSKTSHLSDVRPDLTNSEAPLKTESLSDVEYAAKIK